MGLDEALFGKVHRWLRRRAATADPAREERAVELEVLEKRLVLCASLLAGRPLELRPADDHGGVRGDRLFLPARLDLAATRAENEEAYLVRSVLLVAALLEGAPVAERVAPEPRALATLLRTPELAAEAARRWPGFEELFSRASAAHVFPERKKASVAERALDALERVRCGRSLEEVERGLPEEARRFLRLARDAGLSELAIVAAHWSRLAGARAARRFTPSFFPDLLSETAAPPRCAPLVAGDDPATREALPSGTERRAPARREVEVLELAEPEDQNPLIHVFEKVKTAEEHQAGKRRLDGSDELEQHLEALEELDLRRVVRSRARTTSIYRADLALEGSSADLLEEVSSGPALLYDEWDEGAKRHRKDWCSV